MRMLSFKDGEEACGFCGNVEFDISETLITCTRCCVTYGRVNGVWVVDSQQEKVISPLLTRTQPFNSRETVNTDNNNDGNLEDG
jgi:hypothetical protein